MKFLLEINTIFWTCTVRVSITIVSISYTNHMKTFLLEALCIFNP